MRIKLCTGLDIKHLHIIAATQFRPLPPPLRYPPPAVLRLAFPEGVAVGIDKPTNGSVIIAILEVIELRVGIIGSCQLALCVIGMRGFTII